MKRLVYLVAISVVVSLFMSSCHDDYKTDFSPQLGSSMFLLNGTDTLSFRYIAKDSLYLLDTLALNDTVRYRLFCSTYANDMTSLLLSQEGTSVKSEVLADNTLASILTPESKVEESQLYFIENYNGLILPLQMVAVATGESLLSWQLSSTSKFSPCYLRFRVVVK